MVSSRLHGFLGRRGARRLTSQARARVDPPCTIRLVDRPEIEARLVPFAWRTGRVQWSVKPSVPALLRALGHAEVIPTKKRPVVVDVEIVSGGDRLERASTL